MALKQNFSRKEVITLLKYYSDDPEYDLRVLLNEDYEDLIHVVTGPPITTEKLKNNLYLSLRKAFGAF